MIEAHVKVGNSIEVNYQTCGVLPTMLDRNFNIIHGVRLLTNDVTIYDAWHYRWSPKINNLTQVNITYASIIKMLHDSTNGSNGGVTVHNLHNLATRGNHKIDI